MTQPRRILLLAVFVATLCLLGVPAALRAQTVVDDGHSVVITSFPDGANVLIDGVDTGKVTPMELRRIKPGLHTITVSVASAGWSTDTRTINVLDVDSTGKPRDTHLSFTLLPTVTQGPPGPAGANGGIGVPGAAGPAGPAGQKGDTGATGATGPAGATGVAGPVGPKGDTGATGATGAMGPAGPQGLQGVPGVAGPAGTDVSLQQVKAALLQWYPQTFSLGFGSSPRGIALDGSNIWVANFDAARVTKLRASDGALVGTYPLGTQPYGIAFDGANIWVTNPGSRNVTKLRASDGALVGTYSNIVCTNVAFDGSNIWIVSGNVTKLRASDGAIVGSFPVGGGSSIAFDGSHIWVTNSDSNTVTKLRASDGTLLGLYAVGMGPAAIAFDGSNM